MAKPGKTIIKQCRSCNETGPHGLKSRYGKTEPQAWCRKCMQLRAVHRHMVKRCNDPNHPKYANYGGRGITVDSSFEDFHQWMDYMGPRPNGHSIERIDNDGPYAPGNVRWATMKEQQVNKRTNRLLTFRGKTQTIVEWSEETGFTPSLIWNRLRDWGEDEIERILTEEPDGRRKWTDSEKQTIIKMRNEGSSYADIARKLGHCRQSISKWFKRYRANLDS